MKANELMPGDLVTFKNCQYSRDAVIIKIWGINQEGNALVFIDDSEVLDEVTIDEEFAGIPLTPEILKKNGFVSKKGRFMQLGNFDNPPLILWHLVDNPILRYLKGQLEIHHGAENNHVSFMCHYVHEFQHALKLCRIEKTIEL